MYVPKLEAASGPCSAAKSLREIVKESTLALYMSVRPSGIAAKMPPPLGAAIIVVLT